MAKHTKKQRPEDMFTDTPCRCGHEIGDHRSSRDRECLTEGCGCDRFHKAPAAAVTL